MPDCKREPELCQDEWIKLKAERDDLYESARNAITACIEAINLMGDAMMGKEIDPKVIHRALEKAKKWKTDHVR